MLLVLVTAVADSAAGNPAPDWGRIVLSMVAVLGLIGGLALLLKQMRQRIASSGGLMLEASLPLGRQERVVVVRVGNSRLLLGVTAHQVATLAKLPDAPLGTPQPQSQVRRWPWSAQERRS
ncbi:MAG: flagellar biosynthetic protein FliO [Gammaproteobacteria bacterium]|nr:flagellar biosynthetic protein FliO [Gammaproteobacteria bacterium]